MTPRELIRLSTLGGPGLDGYAYCADVYCTDCGESIINDLATSQDHWDDIPLDTDTFPQPIFFGESPDYPQHCSDCGQYLYGENADD
jgi:hypothetical protein